jgi:uncharacterized cupredoxin-like copper-binding protein
MSTENVQKKRSMTVWYILAAIIVIVVIVVGVVLYEQSLTPGPSSNVIEMTLYEGEVSTTSAGFADSASSLTIPGPTLTFNVNQAYKMTVYNVGAITHSWAITASNSSSSVINPGPLFNSESNPGTYIAPGGSGLVTFTPTQSGNFYVCPVGGHSDLGMWGNVVINP